MPATPKRSLIQHGLVLVSPDQDPIAADILIEDGAIAAMGCNLDGPFGTEIINASGLLLTPGLMNSNVHSHEHFHKGRFDNLPLELWMNFIHPPVALPPLTPKQVYLRTMVGAMEAVRTGTTFIVDDVNFAPHYQDECIEAVFQAYEDIGLRGLVGVSLFDRPLYRSVPFFDAEMPEPLRQQLDAQPPPDGDRLLALVKDLAQRHPPQRQVGFLVAPSAPHRCTDAFLVRVHHLAEQEHLPMMMHLLETRLQAVAGRLLYGGSVVAHLDNLGVLSSRLALQHCVWLTLKDVERLAIAGCSAIYNPLSNLKLGSGQMNVRQFLLQGVNVALASDGCGSRASLNMLSVVQAAALLNKSPLLPPEAWLSAAESFSLATQGGAKAFGYEGKLGRLEPGYLADLVGYRLDDPAFLPLNVPLNQLVYAETGSAVDLVVVHGTVILQRGHFTRIDEDALMDDIRVAHRQLLPLFQESEASARTFLPYYRRMYDRCLQEKVDPAMITPVVGEFSTQD